MQVRIEQFRNIMFRTSFTLTKTYLKLNESKTLEKSFHQTGQIRYTYEISTAILISKLSQKM